VLFNSSTFVVFFALVYLLYLASSHRKQNLILLIASYIFYASWDWRFLSLILISTLADFILGHKIYLADTKKLKKIYMLASLTVNLGILGFFKYFNFFIDNLSTVDSIFGLQLNLPVLNILLPVGISFYTFQTLSYSLDIYRGQIRPVRSILNFALFVAYFPQLVAGPIERAKSILPQIENARTIDFSKICKGLWLIVFGYFLKVYVADNLAPIVNTSFDKVGVLDGSEALTSVYAFAFQILGDFAGYSSIAIGISMLMGIKLMTNFKQPYFVTNPQEFWRHWHISLSTWLRDYLYISLGGNRKGVSRTNINLFLTMLLGGIWHGAAWNFVLWGIYQGAILIIHRLFSHKVQLNLGDNSIIKYVVHLMKVIFMFHVTCYGWLIFRAGSIEQIVSMTKSIFLNFVGFSDVAIYNFKAVVFYSLLLIFIQYLQYKSDNGYVVLSMGKIKQAAIFMALIVSVLIFGEFGASEFIYFKF
jgi:D-alanyl-lipoteichoic acid acyltransferase DltB (MBOAT superfamily)